MYDGAGQRVLRRSTNGSTTSLTVYAFGQEEHSYTSTGSNQGNTYYYTLAGHLVGKSDGGSTTFYQTDLLGSVVADLSNTAGSAAIKGNEVYGPYGKQRYNQGTHGTPKGFTGQYNDALTGLDYYTTRYYDPVVGVFLSADSAQGNNAGENPYAYVNGNPETYSDPTGQIGVPYAPTVPSTPSLTPPPDLVPPEFPLVPVGIAALSVLDVGIAFVDAIALFLATPTPLAPAEAPPPGANAISIQPHLSGPVISIQPHSSLPQPPSSLPQPPSSPPQTQTGGSGGGLIPPMPVSAPGAPCSFTPDTRVRTQQGEKAIGTLHVGDKVLAYNPKTQKMELEPILHVWTHKDNDLVDLTITSTIATHQGKSAIRRGEVIHTTNEHPFLTTEHGSVPAGKVKVGMHMLRADGSVGMVTGWGIVHGTKVMYNLEVAQDHTFTVGDGQWVVHNECDSRILKGAMEESGVDFQQGQQAHHVIPCALQNHDLINAAGSKFDINAEYNGRVLWNKAYRANALDNMEPYHANAPSYTRYVESLMDNEYQRLQSSGTLSSDTAAASLMNTINGLNNWIDVIGWFGALGGKHAPLLIGIP